MRKKLIIFGALCLLVQLSLSCSTKKSTIKSDVIIEEAEVKEKHHDSYYNFTLSRLAFFNKDLKKSIEYMELAEAKDPDSAFLKYNIAILYLAQGLNTDAKSKLKEAIELDPEYTDAYKLLARLNSSSTDKREKKQAEKYLKKAIKIDPDDADSYFLLALYYLSEGDYTKAKNLLNETIKIKPYDKNALLFLGELFREEDNLEDAKFIYSELLNLNPKDFNTILALASIEEKLGEQQNAQRLYKDLIRFHKNNPKSYEHYGNYLYRIKKYDDALIQFRNAEILDLGNPDIKFKIAVIYLEKKKPEQAIEQLDEVLKLSPNNEVVLYYKALAYVELERYSDAELILYQIPPASEYYDNALVQKAYILEKKGDSRGAVEVLEKAHAEYPGNELITNYLGGLYRKEKNYNDAIELYSKFLEHDPGNQTILYSLGVTYFSMEDEDKSIEIMKSLLEVNPDHADALNFIGYTYAENGVKLEEAEQYIKQALRLSPNTGYIIDSLGWVYYKQGRLEEAIKYLILASELSPDDAAIYEHLGDAYSKNGDLDKALSSYKYALELIDINRSDIEDDEMEDRVKNKISGLSKKITFAE